MLEELQVIDDPEPRDAALNMAIDEALVETANLSMLRFYRWRRPSVSFGYFGRYADVADSAKDRAVVRRWTGGGIVPHEEDLTYSLIIPATEPLFTKSSREIYAAVHDAIRRALIANRFSASLANAAAPKFSEHCFANPVAADVMMDGRKIAGAAQRRTRKALLHQGSIQRPDLPREFRRAFSRVLCEDYELTGLSPALLARAQDISESRYSTEAWLTRR